MKKINHVFAYAFLILFALVSYAGAAAALFNYPKFHAQTAAGVPLSGGLVYTYSPGTSTPKATYSDVGLTTPNANPVVLDANGDATIYMNGLYKVILKNSAGVTQWTMDNIGGIESAWSMHEVDALNVYGDGVNYTQATIASALTAIGTVNKTTLLLRPGTWIVSSNADWSAYTNVTFKIVPGAVISHGAFTLSIPTLSIADGDLSQKFSGTGRITWGNAIEKLYPQWYGAKADNTTDDQVAIQKCFDDVLAITSGPKPVIKLVGRYAYTGDIYTRLATDDLAYGVVISGTAGGRRGDAATIEGLTTLTNIGTGTFYFGRLDTASYRPWMIGSTLENIQFVGNANVDGVGLWTASNNSIFKNIHVTGYTKSGTVGWKRTGEVNSYYDSSMTNNYDGGRSVRGGSAAASNNLNNYYSIVWAANTRYGENPTKEHGPNYYGGLWQLNGADGYRHETAGNSVNFFGGWIEGNNVTTAGYQFDFRGTATDDRAKRFNMQGTHIGGGGASVTSHVYLANTTNARLYPAWYNAANQFANGGANIGLETNQPNSYSGTEGAPSLNQTGRTVAGASRARYTVAQADLDFADGWGFQRPVYHYPDTNDSGAAYGFMTSSKALEASASTAVFLITFDDNYGQGYFTFTYTGMGGNPTYYHNGIKAERHIRLAASTATITTIGADDLRGSTPPAIVWTDNGNNTITVSITNNNASTSTGHAVIEGRGGGSDANTGLRGFTFGVL